MSSKLSATWVWPREKMNGILSDNMSCERVTSRWRMCTGTSCGSVAPPNTWITSKLWHSFIKLRKSSIVPARRPLAVPMMFGGPEVGAKATCRFETGTWRSGSTECSVMSRGALASEAPTSTRPKRTICVVSSTSAPACRKMMRASAESTFIPWVSSITSAVSCIAATWSSENTLSGSNGLRR
jgi:hypothetical protein